MSLLILIGIVEGSMVLPKPLFDNRRSDAGLTTASSISIQKLEGASDSF
jgi:hypothetical protein